MACARRRRGCRRRIWSGRAAWYAEKLGLEPAEERPGGLRYVVGGCEFALFASAGASDGSFTQMGFEVADLRATVAELRRRGVRVRGI